VNNSAIKLRRRRREKKKELQGLGGKKGRTNKPSFKGKKKNIPGRERNAYPKQK